MKLSRNMEEALRVMKKTGARIIWSWGNDWLLLDGKREMFVENVRCPSVTISDALERRGLIERSNPPPEHKSVYTITEKGKQAVCRR